MISCHALAVWELSCMYDYAQQQRSPVKQVVGVGGVTFIFLVLGGIYATWVDKVPAPVQHSPMQAVVIRPVKPPPPPPPPPPQLTAPPPPYIPPPRIKVPTPPKPVIRHVTHTKPPVSVPPAAHATVAPTPAAPPGPAVPDHVAGSRPINHVALEYPGEAQDEGREGHVSVICDVETTGETSNCKIASVTGGQDFARAALDYVRKARYVPATANGIPVKEFHHTYTISFSLND